MQHKNAKQTDNFRKMIGSAVLAAGATTAVIGGIWIFKPSSPSSGWAEASKEISIHSSKRTVVSISEDLSSTIPSTVERTSFTQRTTQVPDELQQDGMDATRFAAIKKLAQESPQEALPQLIDEYNKAETGKAYWAEAIGFVYLDQLNKTTEALTWMETAIHLNTQNKDLLEALVQLYAKTDEIERAAEFLHRMEDGPVKDIFRAKLLYMGQNYKESRALLKTIPEADLDEASKRLLERTENGEAS